MYRLSIPADEQSLLEDGASGSETVRHNLCEDGSTARFALTRLPVKFLLLLPALLLLLATPAHAVLRFPPPPDPGQHVVDPADLITPDDEAEIEQIAQKLLEQERTQLVVVAIDSMAQYGGARMNIEDYAARLFQQWGIGFAEASSPEESQGILLLVSRLDRKARIELGGGWGYERDSECWRLMQDHLVPAFKKGNYSSGLVFGASALNRMARGLSAPRPPLAQEQLLLYGSFGALGLFTLVSLVRSGSSGWAWIFWGVVFSILWTILKLMLTPSHNRRRGYSSYGSSYGSSYRSSGSSSSSGGGATGSW
jgi:uncharacterized protein